MNTKTYSHLCSQCEWDDEKVASVIEIVRKVGVELESGRSSRLREAILKGLGTKGWSSKVRLSHNSQITITAMNGDLALCLQPGNMSRFYADLLKLQYLYQKGTIKSAIYILPSKRNARLMGSNLAHFERFVEELKLFSEIITIPVFVIGMD